MPHDATRTKTEDAGRRLGAILALDAAVTTAGLAVPETMARLLAGPLQWATGDYVSVKSGVLDYPYGLIWGLPLAGMAIAWLLRQGGLNRPALWVAALPIVFLAMVVGGFRLLPPLLG
jgi:hypothetical protein